MTRTKPSLWSPGINRQHPQARGIALAYLFNEGAGTLARDLGPFGSDGILTNFTFGSEEGWVGQGIRGDGSTTYIDIPQNTQGWGINTPSLSSTEAACTIFARCKFTADSQGVFEFSDDGAANGGITFFTFGGNYTVRIAGDGGGTDNLNIAVSYPVEGVYAVRVDTRSGFNDRSLWLDGVELGSNSIGTIANDLTHLRLLAQFGGFLENSQPVDYIIVYNRALSDSEIKQYSIDPLAPFRKPQLAWMFSAGVAAPSGSLFRRGNLDGLGVGGPFFADPLAV